MVNVLPAFTGLCAGLVSGASLCAFYIALGVFSKSAQSLGIEKAGVLMAVFSAMGVMLGTLITIFGLILTIGAAGAAVFGLFGGFYVGIVIACLAEVTDAIPVVKNFGLTKRVIVFILLGFVLGKAAGSIIYWLSGVF